jgi:fibronectin-binding autotransporter adhesin
MVVETNFTKTLNGALFMDQIVMRLNIKNYLGFILCFLAMQINAQTSWTGATDTKWRTSSNWTNGVPSSSKDAIIGDANFTGSNQPYLDGNGSCQNLYLGTSTKVSSLTITRNLTVYGDVFLKHIHSVKV